MHKRPHEFWVSAIAYCIAVVGILLSNLLFALSVKYGIIFLGNNAEAGGALGAVAFVIGNVVALIAIAVIIADSGKQLNKLKEWLREPTEPN